MNSLVSVIIPCYNGEKYIAEAISSVLSQTHDTFECIIVDDGCTDNSIAIAKKVCGRDERFRIYSQKNRGLGAARNKGILLAKGAFIAFLDADDKWHPQKLSKHVSILTENTDIGVTYSWTRFIDENGVPLRHCRKPRIGRLTNYYLFCRNPITNGSNGVFRKTVFDLHKFDEELSHGQDVDCWLRITFSKDSRWIFKGIPLMLTYYRINTIGLSNNYDAHYACCKRMWNKAREYNQDVADKYVKTAEAFQFRFYARRAIASEDYTRARYFIIKALRKDPLIIVREPLSTLATLCVAFAFFR